MAVCDWICKNPAGHENTQVVQCIFLVAQVEKINVKVHFM